MAKVSVVIPNYNGEKFIKECLESLRNQEEGTPDFDIIFVDDASTDSSVDLVTFFPEVKLIQNKENLGFAGTVNVGIKASDAEYVILLNNDTKVKPGFVKNLYGSIKGKDKVFSVSSKMLTWDNEEIIDDAGDIFTILGWARSIGKLKPAKNYEESRKVFSACGGASIYSKKILEEIGLFDENHFAYLEDLDIGYRAKIFGYDNLYEPSAEVVHYGSASFGSRYSARKAYLTGRNNVYLIYKNMPLLQWVINLPFLLLGFAIKILFYVKKGFAKDFLHGMKDGFIMSAKDKKHKVRFVFSRFLNYLKIEVELLANTCFLFFD